MTADDTATDTLDVVVSGGSMAGLFTGVALRARGHDVDVYERSTGERRERGAGIVAQQPVLDFLDRHDLANPADVTTQTERREFLAPDGSVARGGHGPMRFTSWDAVYRRLRAGFPDNHYHPGHETVDITPEDPAVSFADGRRVEGDLIVAAEGLRSTVRERLLPDAEPEYAGYVAWRGTVPETAVPEQVREQFTSVFTFHEAENHLILGYPIPGPDGSVEPGERRLNWVWYDNLSGSLDRETVLTDAAGRRREGAVPPGELWEAVWNEKCERLAGFPDVFETLVRETDDPFVQSIFDLTVSSMVEDRVCLVGDAAFVARPHTAAGTSKAAGDGVTLAEAIESHADLDAALADWESERLAYGQRIVERGVQMGDSYMK
ncbi:FAD binding domain-containing protein [Halospeciosus flavus]|uniref:FAD binding domain-containing protein n=1 Tax=Halospeciosus flavus TaxID=3032283 RepID=A0ABD5Z3Q2_9EURY|nr:FAD binding domain-containing protein [Halospeciosus flavus]